jgi:hypothetical protein
MTRVPRSRNTAGVGFAGCDDQGAAIAPATPNSFSEIGPKDNCDDAFALFVVPRARNGDLRLFEVACRAIHPARVMLARRFGGTLGSAGLDGARR